MEQFSTELKKAPHPRKDDFTRTEETLRRLIELRVKQSDGFALSPVSKLPAKLAILMQVGLRRAIELAEAAIREANRMNVVSTTVLTRAVFETGCLLFDVITELEDITGEDNVGAIGEFDKYVTNTILGHGPKAKTFVLADQYIVQNVLTIIQRLSKRYEVPLEGFYEGLCEYAHPNYIGMMSVYTESNHAGGITLFTDRRSGRGEVSTFMWLGALATALQLAENSIKRWNNTVRDLAMLAERRIYEQGTWPKDVDYPIRRE